MASAVHHVRSTSLPCSSHPLVLKAEEEISKMKNSERICIGGLEKLYICIDDLIQMYLAHQGQKKWVEQELDRSVKFLDLCNNIRGLLSAMKEHVLDLYSSLRRRGNSKIAKDIDAYVHYRKKAQKEVSKCLRELKKMEDKFESDKDNELPPIVPLLSEVRAITISQFSSILSSMSLPKTSSKWSLVSKAMQKKKICPSEGVNDEENVDASLIALSGCCKDVDAEKIIKVQKQLKALEMEIEGVESGLEQIYGRLIQNRVSLLNILIP